MNGQAALLRDWNFARKNGCNRSLVSYVRFRYNTYRQTCNACRVDDDAVMPLAVWISKFTY